MNGKPFTDDEVKLLMDESLTHTEIAKITGRAVSTISIKRRAELKLKAKDGRLVYTGDLEKLIYDTTKTNQETVVTRL